MKKFYRVVIRIPGAKSLLTPVVKKLRQSNFDFDETTSLEARIIFLESALAGLEERIEELER
jgi:hypothetical protein